MHSPSLQNNHCWQKKKIVSTLLHRLQRDKQPTLAILLILLSRTLTSAPGQEGNKPVQLILWERFREPSFVKVWISNIGAGGLPCAPKDHQRNEEVRNPNDNHRNHIRERWKLEDVKSQNKQSENDPGAHLLRMQWLLKPIDTGSHSITEVSGLQKRRKNELTRVFTKIMPTWVFVFPPSIERWWKNNPLTKHNTVECEQTKSELFDKLQVQLHLSWSEIC